MEAFAGEVALVKPQSAFFERHGSAGIAVLERVLADAREAGTLVLLDVKRGDIGSTMGGYADAYLTDGSPLAADAVTLSPYLGFGSLDPALTRAASTGRGVFVLARTSNPDGAVVQLAERDGRAVAQAMVDAVAARNAGAAPAGQRGRGDRRDARPRAGARRSERPGAGPRPRRAGRHAGRCGRAVRRRDRCGAALGVPRVARQRA